MTHTLSWWGELTDDKAQSPSELRKFAMRVFCHLLVDLMPEVGLDEMKESLSEALEYYRIPPSPVALPPPMVRIPVRVARTYERPEFHAVEEY